MINIEETIIRNIISSPSLALFTFRCSQLSRCVLVKVLDYPKNKHRVMHRGIRIT